MGNTRRPSRDSTGLLVLLILGVCSLVAIPAAGATRSDTFRAVTGSSQLLFAVLAVIFAVRTARSSLVPPGVRRAWRAMLPAYTLWPLTIVLFSVFPGQQFPSVPDVLRLLIGPATLAGFFSFANLPADSIERAKLRLDAGLVAAGSAMVLWYLMVSPAMVGQTLTWRELVPSVLHPLFGAALLFGISVVLLRSPQAASSRRPLFTLVAATLLILAGDAVRAYDLNNGGSLVPTAWQTGLWTAGMFLLMIAPYLQSWFARRPDVRQAGTDTTTKAHPPRWPYLAVLPGYVVLLSTVGVRDPFPAGGLILGAMVVSVLALGRQMVSAQESRRLAVTDGLTGLANRVRLYEALPQALARAARNGTRVGVLIIDMDGFKQVNDRLGHHAGDQLLIGFGALLRRCVLGSDMVARLGGDEFVILLPDLRDPSEAAAVTRRVFAAMAQPIDVGATVVQPAASIGSAVSEPGEQDVDSLLNRADLAMYDRKAHRSHA